MRYKLAMFDAIIRQTSQHRQTQLFTQNAGYKDVPTRGFTLTLVFAFNRETRSSDLLD